MRADRVVCHGDAPRGFLIHGQGATLWTTYLNDGRPARGRDFVGAVRALAARAGLDAGQLDRSARSGERKAGLLHGAFVLCGRELASERGTTARAYLASRGIPAARIDRSGLGLMPDDARLRLKLISHGYSDAEIANSGLLADSRWPGRIVGAWRDEQSRVTTLWARTIEVDDDDRYLYLRGAPRASAMPYALSGLLAGQPEDRAELVLVEGVLDVHILQAHGVEGVAALGGTATSERLFQQLADCGIQNVTLALDNDPAGRTATIRAIERATNAPRSPHIWVVDPDLLDAKDPGDLIQRRGIEAWAHASAAPICGITWRALELTGSLTATTTERERRSALAESGAWFATLGLQHAIEQSRALDTVADTLGYDAPAVQRAFRGRHWERRDATRLAQPGIDR